MTLRGSVVVAAHDEQAVIGRCLSRLLEDAEPGELDVVVVPNGCHDATAAVAARFDVQVVQLAQASKAAALRAGDAMSLCLPRIYLDADVELSTAAARVLLRRLAEPGALAARPPLVYDTTGCAPVVRRYYRARQQMSFTTSQLWGAGVYALSAAGRARFGAFPDLVADDLFVAQLFLDEEVDVVDCEPVLVRPPRTAPDLVRILRRHNKGKEVLIPQQRTASTQSSMKDLQRVAMRGPGPALDAIVYAGLASMSRVRQAGDTGEWERDDSSRALPAPVESWSD